MYRCLLQHCGGTKNTRIILKLGMMRVFFEFVWNIGFLATRGMNENRETACIGAQGAHRGASWHIRALEPQVHNRATLRGSLCTIVVQMRLVSQYSSRKECFTPCSFQPRSWSMVTFSVAWKMLVSTSGMSFLREAMSCLVRTRLEPVWVPSGFTAQVVQVSVKWQAHWIKCRLL